MLIFIFVATILVGVIGISGIVLLGVYAMVEDVCKPQRSDRI